LGTDLLSYYTAEFILCTYPRLPITVIWSAMHAYIGERTLAAITKEWGVEFAVEPGPEVDSGLLQFKRLPPGVKPPTDGNEAQPGRRRGYSARTVTDNALGEGADSDRFSPEGVTASRASANFVKALIGALYLHGGRPATSKFFKEHFMSRELAVGDLFSFSEPARDLSRLCAREGFQQPVARILSETGRLTRHPVFNVGVFSGKDKLGEGSGSSLPEARFRAAAAALKAWYLYKPLRVRVPSSMEDKGARPWEPVYIDPGEVIV
jgi:dsRNA-specific ribonuclease